MVRVSSLAKLRPWSELTAKMAMGVVPRLVRKKKNSQRIPTLKTVTSLNKEARLLKFYFPKR